MSEKLSTGFVLADNPAQLQNKIRNKLSFTTGRFVSGSTIRDISELTEGRKIGSTSGLNLSDEYIQGAPSSTFQKYQQTIDQYNNKYIHAAISYGIYLPSYLKELRSYHNEFSHKQYSALLIGCLTISSAQEFIGAINSVFDHNSTNVIDIQNNDLVGNLPNFQVMNGLNTSFEDKTFETIHTNFLLHQLIKNKDQKPNDSFGREKLIEKFFKETFRLLKPNGKLILVEGNLLSILDNTRDPSCVLDMFKFYLTKSGFKDILVKAAMQFVQPQDLMRSMQVGPTTQINIDSYQTKPAFGSFIITARK